MSYYEDQENIFEPHDLAKSSRHFHGHRRHRRGDALLQKKLADHVVVSRTLCDPANTLSNRAKKRLQRDESQKDFQPDVQYSTNKHQRWKTVNVPALLESNRRSDLEVLVVNRVITPRRPAEIEALNVSNVHSEDNGTISTIYTKGKGHNLSHFQATLRERRQMDKDEVEPARILINIVEPHPVLNILAGKTQRNSKKGSWTTKSRKGNYNSDISEESCSDDEDSRPIVRSTESSKTPRSLLTLGDFLPESSAKSIPHERDRKSSSWSFVDAEPKCSEESIQPKPADLVDISAVTNANTVFEVLDLETKKLLNFDFHESISYLEQERCIVRWIDTERVMVDATYQARLSGDEPMRKPLLILFFELRENAHILRCRINANVRYGEVENREVFLSRARRQTDFVSVFQSVIEFVKSLRLRELDDPKKKSRCSENPTYFAAEVNSEVLAVKADRSHEYDRLEFLREKESAADHRRTTDQQPHSSVCCRCLSSKRSEVFETSDGMACKDCIASDVIHQLRLNRLPLDIPLTSTENVAAIDHLYAVLPAPLISEVVKVVYSYYCRLNDPSFILSECPRCSVDVAIMNSQDESCCVCPECESHWCWKCSLEPHWPMNCEEFKQWIDKWDRQYFVDKHRLQSNEDLLRITCQCGNVLYLPSESAHNTICSRCHCRYDKTGMICRDHLRSPYYPYLRKVRNLDGKPKDGVPVTVEQIPLPKLIAKEFADICADARNLRFDKKRRLEFEKSANAPHLEGFHLCSQRRTGLVLVENCTAWLYLHRREGTFGTTRSAVSRLFQKLRLVDDEIRESSLSPIFLRNAEDLSKDIRTVMKLFQGYIHTTTEPQAPL